VSDADDAELRELRRRDEALAAGHWHALAALYHFMTRWRGEEVWDTLPEGGEGAGDADELVRMLGAPPGHFHSLGAAHPVALPPPTRTGPLYELLGRRRTTRAFDLRRSLAAEELSVLLYHTFGCHGFARLAEGLVGLRKTSPSGGALHPTEAYLLVRDVEGVESGLYHYDVRRHALESVAGLGGDEAGELAVGLAAGQPYVRDAHLVVLLVARFARSFWKYRRHDRAYAVLLMDVAHLSQTFYLVCAELGLGAFVTAAVNGADAEERLGIDGFQEGVLGLCGCGPPAAESPLDPEFLPYVPGQTVF
jgi:putative peptide maturation dehydrogenase